MNNDSTTGPTHVTHLAAYVGARKKKLIVSVAIIGIILLCGYVFLDTAWRNSECGLSPSNLVRRVRAEEVETGSALKGKPEWEALKAKMILIDELWLYNNHGVLSGNDGYVVLRLGAPIACIATIWY